jgi:hypothetical protein
LQTWLTNASAIFAKHTESWLSCLGAGLRRRSPGKEGRWILEGLILSSLEAGVANATDFSVALFYRLSNSAALD